MEGTTDDIRHLTSEVLVSKNFRGLMYGVGVRSGFSAPHAFQHYAHREIDGNWLFAPPDMLISSRVVIKTNGHRNNYICIGNTHNSITIDLYGDRNTISFAGNGYYKGHIGIHSKGDGQKILIGSGCNINGLMVLAIGNEIIVRMGDGCLVSTGVTIRTQDEHGIIDASNGDWLNKPQDVIIEPHVWLGKESSIYPGVQVSSGSIVGERALVNKNIPSKCAVAGVPARIIRENVTWVANPEPSPEDFQRVSETLSIFSGRVP